MVKKRSELERHPRGRNKRCVSVRSTSEGERVYVGTWSLRGVVNARPIAQSGEDVEAAARAVAREHGIDHYFDHRDGAARKVVLEDPDNFPYSHKD